MKIKALPDIITCLNNDQDEIKAMQDRQLSRRNKAVAKLMDGAADHQAASILIRPNLRSRMVCAFLGRTSDIQIILFKQRLSNLIYQTKMFFLKFFSLQKHPTAATYTYKPKFKKSY